MVSKWQEDVTVDPLLVRGAEGVEVKGADDPEVKQLQAHLREFPIEPA